MQGAEGQPFGKYLLLDRIATGGMAEIYRGRLSAAAGVTKPVVIKKILPHYSQHPNFLSMFVNEAKIAAGLSHGNIAQVFDFGEIDGEYYLAMEYVHGQPLSAVLRRAQEKGPFPLPAPFAVWIAIEVCRGLHHAHTRTDEFGQPLNIIHRDVSPQNVMLSYEGQVKLVDFGIAKAKHATQVETQAGAMKGKYVYFSPEQAEGKPLDSRADLYATGVVLYEMLCGRLPWEGKMIEVLAKIVTGNFPRPRALREELSPALERIVLQALERDREHRFANGDEMAQALSGYLFAHVPSFGQSSLAQLLAHLYPEEMAPLGAQLAPSAEIQRLLTPRPLPAPPQPERVTTLDRAPRARASPPVRTADVPRPQPRGARWPYVLAPALAMALAAASIIGVELWRDLNVRVTSQPSGAEVWVDGRPVGARTPLLVSDLEVLKPHRLELRLPGHQPWRRSLPPGQRGTLSFEAQLVPGPPQAGNDL